jgi:hypothetical protein
MSDQRNKIWPFSPKASIFSTVIVLILLLVILGFLRSAFDWPAETSTNTVLMGILFISLVPLMLLIIDIIIDKGAVIAFKDFKIDFSKVGQLGTVGFNIPVNIGVRGEPLNDSSSSNILGTLGLATSSGTVVLDLEDGHAWWETRLFVLLAGAERLGKPDKIVFVATEEGTENCFQGWGKPKDLLHCLNQSNPVYYLSLTRTRSAAMQWQLVEPLQPVPPDKFGKIPPKPSWITSEIASRYTWMAFNSSGLPNKLFAEQILQSELGEKIETKEGSKPISIVRLNELFKPFLNTKCIDQNSSPTQQKVAFLGNDSSWIAITNNRKYSSLVSRMAILNEMLKPLIERNSTS